jgi:hypothetical protein
MNLSGLLLFCVLFSRSQCTLFWLQPELGVSVSVSLYTSFLSHSSTNTFVLSRIYLLLFGLWGCYDCVSPFSHTALNLVHYDNFIFFLRLVYKHGTWKCYHMLCSVLAHKQYLYMAISDICIYCYILMLCTGILLGWWHEVIVCGTQRQEVHSEFLGILLGNRHLRK